MLAVTTMVRVITQDNQKLLLLYYLWYIDDVIDSVHSFISYGDVIEVIIYKIIYDKVNESIFLVHEYNLRFIF